MLLAVAEEVFARRGFHATSVQEIANTAGFSVGGVYQFCESKADLYLQVIDDQWRQYFSLLDANGEGGGFLDRLTGITRASLEYFEARREFFRMFLADRPRFTGKFRTSVTRSLEDRQQQLKRQIVALMRSGISEGLVRDVAPDFLASAYLGVLHAALLDALAGDAPHQDRPREDAILAVFVCGAAHRERYAELCGTFHL